MKKQFIKRTMCCTALAAVLVLSGSFGSLKAEASAKPSYLKSVTYFSDEWPINFWSGESRFMEEELRQIAEDGFNSIILILPWREFQPDINQNREFNPYAMEKLDRIMQTADQCGLWVTVRLGYTWDYYDTSNAFLRFESLLDNHQTQTAWKVYASEMYQTLAAYPNFYGGFITWEDFWGITDEVFTRNDGAEARKKAESSGYTSYLRRNYSLEEISSLYGSEIRRYSDIAFPKRESPAARLVYEWYDEFLNTLLSDTQKVFPGLSMETRLDQDLVYDAEGNASLFSHEKTYSCGEASYMAAMIGVPMGQINQGERISASKAIATLSSVLGSTASKNGGKPMYFEQFLYMDNTEAFSTNAQVSDEELPAFITGMAPVLKQYGMGYGLWVYRDYAVNLLYNPQFVLGLRGWSGQKGVIVETRGETPMVKLPAGMQLKQRLHGSTYGNDEGLGRFSVSFRAVSEMPAEITVHLGNANQSVKIDGDQVFEVNFYGASGGFLTFESDETVYLDDIKAYRHVQEARCRDINGRELSCLPAIRELNRALGN